MPAQPSDEQQVDLLATGEPLYQVVTRREYIATIENLVDSIDLDVLVINRLGKVIVWNRSVARKWCDKEEAIGADFRDLMPQFLEQYEGYKLGESIIEGVIGKGQTIDIDRFPQKLRSGKTVICDFKAYPLHGRGDSILGAILVMNDITEKIQLEQQLIRHARTTSLAKLGANMAHEVRNPLNSIQLNIELLQEGLEGGSVDREGLSRITELVLGETRRLNDLITHFLEFARPPEPKLVTVSPNEAITRAARLLGEEAKRRGVEMVMDLPELPPVEIDPHQIQQAVYNIALNGIQLMTSGGVLSINGRAHPDYIVVRISDSGPGIAPEARTKLFDLFYSSREGGTGLGLPTANRIVESHRGKLEAGNRPEGGAVFSIYLPLPR